MTWRSPVECCSCVIYILPLLLSYNYTNIPRYCGVLQQAAFLRVNFIFCWWPVGAAMLVAVHTIRFS